MLAARRAAAAAWRSLPLPQRSFAVAAKYDWSDPMNLRFVCVCVCVFVCVCVQVCVCKCVCAGVSTICLTS